jgi:small GTP-binding protein
MSQDGEMKPRPEVVKLKVCLAGEAQVGKTSIVRRFVLDQFDDHYLQTLGAKVSKKEVVIPRRSGGRVYRVAMTVWDVMGTPGIPELMREGYFYEAQGIIAVCDATRRNTLMALADWEKGLSGVCPGIPWVVLANKADLADRLEVTEADLADFVGDRSWHHLFTSAKTGKGVEEAFRALALEILEEVLRRPRAPEGVHAEATGE